ncbi:hypothetical protein [Streptomyces candidus]|uniref:Uncharacterized protein n=1 Tax=Streptomyces candidus TaxID=67283 RepID=A0A7X0LUA6_9ACTN|nr:hypothetical protein [Streptomyces candidus]MBB6439891.1 hypothetical protein [Streptomyces candidus]GHH58079.1 hypothetical protein GCM10018773_66080 [Streptomyces candidus]
MPEPKPFPTGVLIQTDGTYTDLAVTENDRRPILIEALGGEPDFTHWGTGENAICVIVCQGSAHDDAFLYNDLATRFVNEVRGGSLISGQYGPVVVLGYHPQADQLMHLSDTHRALLASLAADTGEAA